MQASIDMFANCLQAQSLNADHERKQLDGHLTRLSAGNKGIGRTVGAHLIRNCLAFKDAGLILSTFNWSSLAHWQAALEAP